MDNPGLQPPIVPPTPTPPAAVPVETPVITPPPNPTVKKAKKFLPKLAVGTLVMALLVGGLFLGKNLLLQQQRPVEKLAAGTCSGSWTCSKGSESHTYGCGHPNYTASETACTGGGDGQGNFCMPTWERSGGCSWDEGGGDCECEEGDTSCVLRGALCYEQFCDGCNWYDSGENCDCELVPSPSPGCGTIECGTVTCNACTQMCCYTGCYPKDDGCPPGGSPSPSPSASPSPSPSPSASPTLACVDLTKNKTAPTLGDKVIFTCEATFSAPHPVAQFRWKVDEGEWIIEEPDNQMDPITHKASTEGDIYKVGVWTWQCRVCTDSTKTTCTIWGQANLNSVCDGRAQADCLAPQCGWTTCINKCVAPGFDRCTQCPDGQTNPAYTECH